MQSQSDGARGPPAGLRFRTLKSFRILSHPRACDTGYLRTQATSRGIIAAHARTTHLHAHRHNLWWWCLVISTIKSSGDSPHRFLDLGPNISAIVLWLTCRTIHREWGVQTPTGQKFRCKISASPIQPSYEYTDRTLSVEDEMAGDRNGHPPSYAEAKKLMSLTLHTYGCLKGYLKGLLLSPRENNSPPLSDYMHCVVNWKRQRDNDDKLHFCIIFFFCSIPHKQSKQTPE